MAKHKIIARGVTIDIDQLKDDLKKVVFDTRLQVEDIVVQSLEAQIRAIRDASLQRKTVLQRYNISASKGTQDDPLNGAHVVVRDKSNRSYVLVEHQNAAGVNVFNILDAGRSSGESAGFSFPEYQGTSTPNGLQPSAALGNPREISRLIGKPAGLKFNDKGRPIVVYLRPGARLAKVKPRGFYESAAIYALEEIEKGHIVNQFRRSKIRLRVSDVKIGVTKFRYTP